MRTLGDLSDRELRTALLGDGLRIEVGPYIYCIRSPVPLIQQGLQTLYRRFVLADEAGFADFHVELRASSLMHRLRGKLDFYFDNIRPLNQIEYRHAYAFLEWGMNWCVSVTLNDYMKLHAAVVAKDGVAVIMPGLPGAGKSTLCAALALSGWRVLSDEHALIPLGSSDVVPLYRPVSLKNESIQVIKDFDPMAELGPYAEETHKGVVAHMKADLDPASHDDTPLPAKLILFPRYIPQTPTKVMEKTRSESFIFAAHHSFNYSTLSSTGFATMAKLIDAMQCKELHYSDLQQAVRVVDELHTEACSQ
jgi:HprK-related kinase A